jgi:hypothetical protein
LHNNSSSNNNSKCKICQFLRAKKQKKFRSRICSVQVFLPEDGFDLQLEK